MREYKFRAFDDGKMVYFKDIQHLQLEDYEVLRLAKFFCNVRNDSKLMQFTGLKENAFEYGNKDIYESDVIEFTNKKRLVVEWNDDTCQFQYSDGTPINNGERYGSHKMIVGNIYESPELLK